MTCYYSETNWLDVLYTSVRQTPGGVEDAATFLTQRRGVRITPEALRLRLRGQADTRLSVEMLDLLVEWMQEKCQPHALDVVRARAASFGFAVAPIEGSEAAAPNVLKSFLEVTQGHGALATELQTAMLDGRITKREADRITRAVRDTQSTLQILLRDVTSASRKA